MNKKLRVIGLGVALTASAAWGDWISWNVNALIPDNDATGLQDTRTVSGFTDVMASLEVRLRLSAAPDDLAWNGDLYVSLLHDTGFAVLLNRTGRTASSPLGYGDNGFDITFTLAGNDIHLYQTFSPTYDGDGRLLGTWGVDGRAVDADVVLDTSPRTDMLANFTGLDPNGTWTLFVADLNQNGLIQLDSWGLNIAVVPEPGTISLLVLGSLALLRRRRS